MQMSLKKEISVLSWDLFSLFNGFVESGSASFDTDPAQLLIRIRIRNTAVVDIQIITINNFLQSFIKDRNEPYPEYIKQF